MTPPETKPRLAYVDWMRGLACLLMFQTHCYDSWLSPSARQSTFFMYSQLGGTFPAPLFLFLAGISFALVTENLRKRNLPPTQIAAKTINRGAEIFGFGLLFRLQEFVVSWGWAPASDLLRVDILNTIGLSMMLMGVLCWLVSKLFAGISTTAGAPSLPRFVRREPALSLPRGWESLQRTPLAPAGTTTTAGAQSMPRKALVFSATATALAISLLTPLLWTTWRPRFLPWPVESYINGVHNLGTPQAWLFPVFPWTAFAFAGLAVGFLLQSPAARAREAAGFFSLGGAGVVLILLSRWLDRIPFQLYPVYDYWHTSPNFFLLRLGMLGMILTACYAWCRWVIGKWGLAIWGFSPFILLGRESLLVYWVHIEFVYGRVSILPKHSQSIFGATLGLLAITLAMLGLAWLRLNSTNWIAWLRGPIPAPGDAKIQN